MPVLAGRLVCILQQFSHHFPVLKKTLDFNKKQFLYILKKYNQFICILRQICCNIIQKLFELKIVQSCNWQVKIKKRTRREEDFTLIYK